MKKDRENLKNSTRVLFSLFPLRLNCLHSLLSSELGFCKAVECSHFRRDRRGTMGCPRVTSFSHIPNTLSSSGVLGRALAPGHSVTGTCLAKSTFTHIRCVHIWSDFFFFFLPFNPLKQTWVGQYVEGVCPLSKIQLPDLLQFAKGTIATISAN